ncbi:MAG: hypothetical protein FWE18_03735 [Alphaproteobacteria bacterium]|nr:hypothetical protein [Alphaproteobacteria bacterium]
MAITQAELDATKKRLGIVDEFGNTTQESPSVRPVGLTQRANNGIVDPVLQDTTSPQGEAVGTAGAVSSSSAAPVEAKSSETAFDRLNRYYLAKIKADDEVNNSWLGKGLSGLRFIGESMQAGANGGKGQMVGGHYVPNAGGNSFDLATGAANKEVRDRAEWEEKNLEKMQEAQFDNQKNRQDFAENMQNKQFDSAENQRGINNDIRERQFTEQKDQRGIDNNFRESEAGRNQGNIENQQMEQKLTRASNENFKNQQLDLEKQKLAAQQAALNTPEAKAKAQAEMIKNNEVIRKEEQRQQGSKQVANAYKDILKEYEGMQNLIGSDTMTRLSRSLTNAEGVIAVPAEIARSVLAGIGVRGKEADQHYHNAKAQIENIILPHLKEVGGTNPAAKEMEKLLETAFNPNTDYGTSIALLTNALSKYTDEDLPQLFSETVGEDFLDRHKVPEKYRKHIDDKGNVLENTPDITGE